MVLRGCLWAALILTVPVAANAQPGLSGYAVGGQGGFSGDDDALWFVGGGAEFIGSTGLGIGAEYGLFFDDTGGILGGISIDGVLQPLRKRGRVVVPFLAAGYSALTGPEIHFGTLNIGGGVRWWTRDRIGLRVEFRDHIQPGRFGGGHYWTLRAGIGFH